MSPPGVSTRSCKTETRDSRFEAVSEIVVQVGIIGAVYVLFGVCVTLGVALASLFL